MGFLSRGEGSGRRGPGCMDEGAPTNEAEEDPSHCQNLRGVRHPGRASHAAGRREERWALSEQLLRFLECARLCKYTCVV